jgi:hypothetical protein
LLTDRLLGRQKERFELRRDLAWQLGEPERPFFDTHASEDLGAYLHEYRRDLLVRHSV